MTWPIAGVQWTFTTLRPMLADWPFRKQWETWSCTLYASEELEVTSMNCTILLNSLQGKSRKYDSTGWGPKQKDNSKWEVDHLGLSWRGNSSLSSVMNICNSLPHTAVEGQQLSIFSAHIYRFRDINDTNGYGDKWGTAMAVDVQSWQLNGEAGSRGRMAYSCAYVPLPIIKWNIL